jgi:hypothetical protein
MAGLISDQLIAQLRGVAYRQLITPVTIQRSTKTEGAYGTEETWATVVETTGWLVAKNDGKIDVATGGLVGSLGIFELRLRWDTDVRISDKVVIDGGEYIVHDENSEVTISLYLKCGLRRLQ